jgi:hypothetical protein
MQGAKQTAVDMAVLTIPVAGKVGSVGCMTCQQSLSGFDHVTTCCGCLDLHGAPDTSAASQMMRSLSGLAVR